MTAVVGDNCSEESWGEGRGEREDEGDKGPEACENDAHVDAKVVNKLNSRSTGANAISNPSIPTSPNIITNDSTFTSAASTANTSPAASRHSHSDTDTDAPVAVAPRHIFPVPSLSFYRALLAACKFGLGR